VGAHRAAHFHLARSIAPSAASGFGFFDQRELSGSQANADPKAGAAQKATAIHGGQGIGQTSAEVAHHRRSRPCVGAGRFFGQQHT